MSNEIADAIEKTAEYIEQRGFCQKIVENDKGEVCIRGGMWNVETRIAPQNRALKFITDFLEDRGEISMYENYATWNDMPGRTKFEVVNMLHKISDYARTVE